MHKYRYRSLVVTLSVAALAACGGSDNSLTDGGGGTGGGNEDGPQQRVVDARTETVYLNLDTGETTASDETWHLAFNRTNVMVNGGASGDGEVASAIGDPQDAFYASNGEPDLNVFLNASAEAMLPSLQAGFAEPSAWETDNPVSAFGDMYDWSVYDPATGVIQALPDVGYLVRSASGNSYARMRVAEFNFPTRSGGGIESFRMEFQVQAAGTEQLAGPTLVFETPDDFDGMQACFDFDQNSVVACGANTDWDVQVGFSGRDWFLRSNSGPSGSGSGGALGPIAWDELSGYTSATTAADGTSLVRAYAQDATGGTFTDFSWYAYNLQGQHRLWPNYRVYLINTDTSNPDAPVYSLQITGYYGSDGQSGQPVVRWLPVELSAEE